MQSVPLKLGDPVIISQADIHVKAWGPWQFPLIEKGENGEIHVSFHIEADSSTAYGLPKAHAISVDGGNNWQMVGNFEGFGVKLRNGDHVLPFAPKSLNLDALDLPEPVGEGCSYGIDMKYYDAEAFSSDINGWYVLRKKNGEEHFHKEKVHVNFPGGLLCAREGVLGLNFFWRMRRTPEGNICAMVYKHRLVGGAVTQYWAAQFLLSEDNGVNWELVSEIPYAPIASYDPKAELRDGFSEPDIAFLPDGSVLCLLRTTDGNGIGPMYFSRSVDKMRTWSKPEYFDSIGVWPELLTLKNGITLASYGRPGVFIRASRDPEGIIWDDPVAVIKPCMDVPGRDSCSYTAMIELNSNKALLVYSDFNYPDEQGIKRKTILARTVEVDERYQ